MLYPSYDGAVHEFCLIAGGESVAVRASMETTFKNKKHNFLVGDGHFCFTSMLESSGKNHGKSWNLIPEIWWKPCLNQNF